MKSTEATEPRRDADDLLPEYEFDYRNARTTRPYHCIKRCFCRCLICRFGIASKVLHRAMTSERHHMARIHALQHQIGGKRVPKLMGMKRNPRLF